MGKISLTKNELNAQKGSLALYERYLPALNLKKKHLQKEVLRIGAEINEIEDRLEKLSEEIAPWIGLLSEDVKLNEIVNLEKTITAADNIAGCEIPIFVDVVIKISPYDLFETPLWMDDAIRIIKTMLPLRAEVKILKEQQRRLSAELLTTSQRVNLFEKVRIPSAQNIIRRIGIHLGDQQIAAVGWGRIAKKKILESKK